MIKLFFLNKNEFVKCLNTLTIDLVLNMKTVSIVCLWLVDDNSCELPLKIPKTASDLNVMRIREISRSIRDSFSSFRGVQTHVLGICISVSQHRSTEARAVKLIWIWNMEREQWTQTRTKLDTDAKNIPNKLSNNEQCPRPATKITPAGVRRENEHGKTNQTPVWENSLVRSSRANSQKMLCLESSIKFPSLSGRTLFQAQRDEFNITAKGQLNQ